MTVLIREREKCGCLKQKEAKFVIREELILILKMKRNSEWFKYESFIS
jgi:hypothetical protein